MIVVIPAEGDSVATELWYVQGLKKWYAAQGIELIVEVFEDTSDDDNAATVIDEVERFAHILDEKYGYEVTNLEVHAQGGFGAMVLYYMLILYPERIRYGFMIGGAPSEAMTMAARFFHKVIAEIWYVSRIPFFADDPNPTKSETVRLIKRSSTEAMQANRKKYRNQLRLIAKWRVPRGVSFAFDDDCAVYYVPNGETVRPEWWDNTYNDRKAKEVWRRYDVRTTAQPRGNFSFYSLYPWSSLFAVLDQTRLVQSDQEKPV